MKWSKFVEKMQNNLLNNHAWMHPAISKKSLKHAHHNPAIERVTGKPSYTLTIDELNEMLSRELRRVINEDMLVKSSDIIDAINDQIKVSIDVGINFTLVSLMERHLLGWKRIQRDLVPAVQEIDREWTECWEENDHDFDFACDRLQARMDMAIAETTMNQKKAVDANAADNS